MNVGDVVQVNGELYQGVATVVKVIESDTATGYKRTSGALPQIVVQTSTGRKLRYNGTDLQSGKVTPLPDAPTRPVTDDTDLDDDIDDGAQEEGAEQDTDQDKGLSGKGMDMDEFLSFLKHIGAVSDGKGELLIVKRITMTIEELR